MEGESLQKDAPARIAAATYIITASYEKRLSAGYPAAKSIDGGLSHLPSKTCSEASLQYP
jgi:hypothetical protein